MDALEKGTAVTLCLRPEDIVTRGIESGASNAFEATVADLEFLGSFYRASLTAKGAENTRFQADFSVNLMRDLGIAAGKTLTVAFPEDRIRVFGDT